MLHRRLGEVLMQKGLLTLDQLNAALQEQKTSREKLGAILLRQGVLAEEPVYSALAESLGFPEVKLDAVTPDWAAVHMLRARFCESHDIFPFALGTEGSKRRQLLVALADPLNVNAVEEIRFTTGLPTQGYVATPSSVRAAIQKYYHRQSADPATGEGMVIFDKNGSRFVADDPTLEPAPASASEQDPGALLAVLKDRELVAASRLERRYWRLLGLLARKGLLTQEEFERELDPA